MLALFSLLDCLFPLRLLHCAGLVEFVVVPGGSNCLQVGAAWNRMRCFAVVVGFSILLNLGAQNLELCSSPYSCT